MPEHVRNLSDYLQKLFGVQTQTFINREVNNVDIAITTVLRNNPNRLSVVLMNLSGNVIYVSPDLVPTATHGIRLDSNGGFLVLVPDQDFEVIGYEWNAIATADNSDIFIIENVITGGKS